MPISRPLAASLLAAAIALAACNQIQVSDTDIRELTEAEVVEAMTETGTVMLDVRKADKHAAGHIAGSVNIFLPEIRSGDPRLSLSKTIIVYGSGWTDPLAPAGAKRLLALKYANVYLFRGGLQVWRDAGHGVTTIEAPPAVDQPASGDQGTSATPDN